MGGRCGLEEIEKWAVYYNYDIVQLADGEHVVQVLLTPEQNKDWGAAHSTIP